MTPSPVSIPTTAPRLALPRGYRLRPSARVLAAGVALAALIVLIVAARVDPARAGMGTHLQVGLAPCGFLQRTGLPCGTCGMTTSYALFVRGNLLASAYVQPFGCLAALATAMTFWIAAHAAVTGRAAYRVIRRLPAGLTAGVLLTLWVLAWGWKMFIVIRGIDGW